MTATDGEEVGADPNAGSPLIAPVAVETACAAPVQTPWLLLALGNGARPRVDDEGGEPSEPPSVECVAPAAERAVVIVAAQMTLQGPTEPAAGGALTVLVDSSAGAAERGQICIKSGPGEVPASGPAAAAAANDGETTGPDPVEPAIERAATHAPTLSTLDDATAVETPSKSAPQSAVQDAADAGPLDVVAPEADIRKSVAGTLAMWHVAARRSGGDIPPRAPVGQVSGESAGLMRAPATAASRLAHALATAVGQDAAPGDGQSLSTEALPGPRTVDWLTVAADSSARAAQEPSAATVSASQVVAPAAAGPSPMSMTTPAAPPPSAPLSQAAEQVLQQLVSSIKMQWKDGVAEAKLHLRPDALGTVSVSLRVESGGVTAVVRAESAQVQEWVLQHQQTLRQQMEAAGLRLDELVVSPDDQRRQAREETSGHPQHRRPRNGARADRRDDPPRFELLA